jgi:hypothetical protein
MEISQLFIAWVITMEKCSGFLLEFFLENMKKMHRNQSLLMIATY